LNLGPLGHESSALSLDYEFPLSFCFFISNIKQLPKQLLLNIKVTSFLNTDDDPRLDYTGLTKNGTPNGNGTMTWKNGSNYTGQWIDGMKSGFGLINYFGDPFNGESYQGYWKNDMKNGFGTYIHSKNSTNVKYEGNYKVRTF
jgi:hypothetical protein